MKKNAFTLIELIAVIVILSIVLTLSVPSLIGALKNNKEKSLEKINELIILAAKDYVVDYGLEIPRKITQNELCKNYLDCPIINPVTKDEMIFSVIVDENKNYTIDKNELIELKVVLNGGKLSKDISGGYTPNTEIILETPTRERHGFAGWEIVSGDAIIEGSVLKLGTKNSTLVANWVGTPVKLNVDLDGGVSSINYNSEYYTRNTLDLGTPTKENYAFIGWKLVSGDAVLSGNKLTFGLENVSVKATWLKVVEEFAYTGSEQVYTTPITGYYKVQTWGAQGGSVSSTNYGGYGAYSTEIVYLEKGTKLYINVGGSGYAISKSQVVVSGGYNGGGNAYGYTDKTVGSGGGATHIATTSGLLPTLKDSKSSILVVAGGGGGSGYEYGDNKGGSAGGIRGVSGTSGGGGSQVSAGSGTPAGSFGRGGSSGGNGTGGGGGFYGGGGGYLSGSGGGGSSYLHENALYKHVYCYNCSTSTGTDTKTVTGTCVSETPKEDCAKGGKGYAIISYISDVSQIDTIVKNKEYDTIGAEQKFVAPISGYYKLEVWGGQGGSVSSTNYGGYGAYSIGLVYMKQGDIIYINVGGSGYAVSKSQVIVYGGYNGGGNGNGYTDKTVGSGGGATHIATVSGLLSTLKDNTQSILIVAGGGGGSGYEYGDNKGGSAGGIIGVNGTSGAGGKQIFAGTGTPAGSFGQGGSSGGNGTGGGGGFYGGGGGYLSGSGGGGSSYIANKLLLSSDSIMKKMYCYNCQATSSVSTNTETTTCINSLPTENCAKQGSGYAKVTYISDAINIRKFQANDKEEYFSLGVSQFFEVPASGTYKLEVWGGQGGSVSSSNYGGYGAYSTGTVQLEKGTKLYVYVGGGGYAVSKSQVVVYGGYNGGGNGNGYGDKTVGSGGGATHIATIDGLLTTLSSKKDNILIVAGGGGGSGYEYGNNIGGSAGGILGSNGTSGKAGSQTAAGSGTPAGSFGQGGSSGGNGTGGGGGFYGGGGGYLSGSGGGGSSYIGNSLLTNKAMYCYNCTASSDTATKTISTTCTSSSPTKNCSKSGAGHAVITYIGE